MTGTRRMKRMNRTARTAILAALLIAILLLTACAGKETAAEIDLGEGIPAWKDTLQREFVEPGAGAEEGLTGIYVTETDEPDLCTYSYEKTAEKTLEEFGASQVEQYGVFCNMTTESGVPAANYVYYAETDGKPSFVQNYIYEGKNTFGRIAVVHKTDEYPLGATGKTFRIPKGYNAETVKNSAYSHDEIYRNAGGLLPTIRVRQFAKDYFSMDTYDMRKMTAEAKTHYAEYAEGGWTLEEEGAFFEENYQVIRKELMHRNGLDLLFCAYTEGKMLKVKAIIDCGDDFVMIGLEDEQNRFQHITTAIIDSIR